MEQIVVLVDPLGVFQSDSMGIIARQELYIKKLNELSDNCYKLIILTRGDRKDYDSQYVELVTLKGHSRFSFYFQISLVHYLKPFRNNIKLILAGDLWESTFTARLLRSILKIKVPIQSQLHADIGDSEWINSKLIRRLRLISTRLFIYRIDGIRFVSEGQFDRFKSKIVWEGEIVVAPVPSLIILRGNSLGKHPLPKSIGFLGRIHRDRGLSEFLRVCDILLSSNSELQIIVAGDGPGKKSFIKHLNQRTTNLTYLGFLKEEQLSEFWQLTGILVNVAPSESYGRSMREALTNFIPVLATKTPETVKLQETMGNNVIEIITSTDDKEISSKFEKLMLNKITEKHVETIRFEQEKSVFDLANSWLNLIKKYNT